MDNIITPEIKAAEEALHAARKARAEFETQRNIELEAAAAVVRERLKAQSDDTFAALREAKRALEQAKADRPRHPWEGKKVTKQASVRVGGTWGRYETTTIYGVVETRVPETEFPANRNHWGLPDIGMPFVRLLKKDGSVGKAFERLPGWKLAEEN